MSSWLGGEHWDRGSPPPPPPRPPAPTLPAAPANRYWTLVVYCTACRTTHVRIRSSSADQRTVVMECVECGRTWKETGDGDFVRALIPV